MIARRSFSTATRVLFSKAGKNSKLPKSLTHPLAPTASGGGSKKSGSKKESSSPAATETPKASPTFFKNDSYNAPEYFEHNKFSFSDVMVTLAGSRLPQQSNKVGV